MKQNKEKTNTVLVLAIAFLIGILIGLNSSPVKVIKVPYEEKKILEIAFPENTTPDNTVSMRLPAVNANNSGVAAFLTVHTQKGRGNIYVNINSVLSREDTQNSARMAALVASEYTNRSLEEYDFFYNIIADASVLEGPSAGAALAVATIAALENRTLRKDVMMTGSINHDGTIGPAGRIEAKAKAAKAEGAYLFLVPVGELPDIKYEEKEFCRKWGIFEYCQTDIAAKEVDVASEIGIEIREVRDIEEALKLFIAF